MTVDQLAYVNGFRKAGQIRRRNEREQAQRDIREAEQKGYHRGIQSSSINNRLSSEIMEMLFKRFQDEWAREAAQYVAREGDDVPFEVIRKVSSQVWEEMRRTHRMDGFDGYVQWVLREEIERNDFSLTFHVPALSHTQRISPRDLWEYRR